MHIMYVLGITMLAVPRNVALCIVPQPCFISALHAYLGRRPFHPGHVWFVLPCNSIKQ